MTATTVPQIVPGTLTGDLDITSFTVEHYPGDALGIAVRAPRMNLFAHSAGRCTDSAHPHPPRAWQ